jgi:hypothetical protein
MKNHLFTGISSALFLSMTLIAQPAPQPSQSTPAQSPPAGPGGSAPAATGIESVKPLIKATDEEWKVIGPKLQAVVTARQTVMTYTVPTTGRGGFGGGGFPNFGTDSLAGPVGDSPGFSGGRGRRGGFPGGPGAPGAFDPANFAGGPGGPDGAGGRAGFDPAAMAALFAGRGGPGGGGPGGFGGGNNVVSTALAELKTALADSTSTPEQIKAKLAAVRSARAKAAGDLAAAQKNLRQLLTADQDVTLVSLGYLD